MEISEGLHQFAYYDGCMNMTFSRYLLMNSAPALFGIGTMEQAEKLIPELDAVLGKKSLSYIMLSDNASENCAGLPLIQERWPEAKIVCTEKTASELKSSCGYTGDVTIAENGDIISGKDYEYLLIEQSEDSVINRLIFMERTKRIVFTSDLFSCFGDCSGKTVKTEWSSAVRLITEDQTGCAYDLAVLRAALLKEKPSFAAVGHGICLEIPDTVWEIV